MMCLQGLFGRASSSSSPSPLSPASASASTSASSSAPTKNPSSIAAAAEAKKSSVGYSLQTPPSSSSGNSSKGNGHIKAPNKSVPAAASDNSNPASGLPAGKQSVHSAAQLSAPTGDKAATPPSARSTVMQGLKPLLKPKAKAKPSPPLSLQYNFDASASTSISLPRRPAVDPSFSAPTPPASDTDSNMAGAGVRKKPAKKGISKSAANAAAGYYTGGSAGVPAAAAPGAGSEGKLDKMFDSLKGDSDEKDVMAIDSTMAYLTDTLSFNPDGVEIFVALEIVQAPGLGEITRKGFVEGWRDAGGHSSKTAQIQYIKQKTAKLGSDPAYFKQVYRHSFLVGKETHQKAVALDVAKEFWRPLLTVGRPWKTASHDWLELWLEFLGEKWTRSVNRDMWYQLLEFANKTLEDETLGFWSEDGAWPSVIDDFVVWCRDTHNIQPSQEVEMKD